MVELAVPAPLTGHGSTSRSFTGSPEKNDWPQARFARPYQEAAQRIGALLAIHRQTFPAVVDKRVGDLGVGGGWTPNPCPAGSSKCSVTSMPLMWGAGMSGLPYFNFDSPATNQSLPPRTVSQRHVVERQAGA